MITEKHEQDALYATVTNENPALALAEANGYCARVRKNWVLKEIIAKGDEEEGWFIGIGFKSAP